MPIGLGVLTLQYVADFINLVTGREAPFATAIKDKIGAVPEDGV